MVWKLKKRLRYSLIEQDSKDFLKHRGTFFIGPRHAKHYDTKEFIEFNYIINPGFATEKNCRVFAQNSHIAIEVYDYYTKLFNPDYETISVYDERCIVQYFFNDPSTWKDVGCWNPKLTIIPLEDGVEIKRIYDTNYGVESLEVSYILRTGAFLKHKVVFTNRTEAKKTFRAIMKLSGITNNKVKHKEKTERITSEKHILSPFLFIGEDNNNLKLTEYLWSLGGIDGETGDWTATTLKDIILNSHPQGCKADIIIGNFSLSQNESLVVDPNSSTWQVSATYDDAKERLDESEFKTFLNIWVFKKLAPGDCWCSGLRFQDIILFKGDTITSSKIRVYIYSDLYDDVDCKIYGNKVASAEDFNDNPHIVNTTNRPRTTAFILWIETSMGGYGWKEKTGLKGIIQELVNQAEWNSGNSLALMFITESGEDVSIKLNAYDYDQGYPPELIIEWEASPINFKAEKLSIPDNISCEAIAGRLEAWLDSLNIPTGNTIYSINMKHHTGFWHFFIIYEE